MAEAAEGAGILQGSAGVSEKCGSHSGWERELIEGCKQRSDMIRFMFYKVTKGRLGPGKGLRTQSEKEQPGS